MEKFIGTTIGLMMRHGMYQRPVLIRVQFYRESDSIILKTVSGDNLSAIKKISHIKITVDEYNDRPFDYYDDCVEAKWAMGVMGWD